METTLRPPYLHGKCSVDGVISLVCSFACFWLWSCWIEDLYRTSPILLLSSAKLFLWLPSSNSSVLPKGKNRKPRASEIGSTSSRPLTPSTRNRARVLAMLPHVNYILETCQTSELSTIPFSSYLKQLFKCDIIRRIRYHSLLLQANHFTDPNQLWLCSSNSIWLGFDIKENHRCPFY